MQRAHTSHLIFDMYICTCTWVKYVVFIFSLTFAHLFWLHHEYFDLRLVGGWITFSLGRNIFAAVCVSQSIRRLTKILFGIWMQATNYTWSSYDMHVFNAPSTAMWTTKGYFGSWPANQHWRYTLIVMHKQSVTRVGSKYWLKLVHVAVSTG